MLDKVRKSTGCLSGAQISAVEDGRQGREQEQEDEWDRHWARHWHYVDKKQMLGGKEGGLWRYRRIRKRSNGAGRLTMTGGGGGIAAMTVVIGFPAVVDGERDRFI